jgi:hypothetical protein
MIPTKNQEEAIRRMVAEPTRAVLSGADMGTGKSLIACEVIRRLGTSVNLITAPLHTRGGWARHFEAQNMDEMRVVNNKTKDGKIAWSDLQFGVPGNYFMGRELARLQNWSDVSLGTWVSDESHSWSSKSSRGFKSAKTMRTEFKVAQSATWFGSSFDGAWAPARVLWPEKDNYGEIADRSFYRWVDYWCATEYDPFSNMKKRVVGEKMPGAFVSELPCYVNLKSDLPELEPIEIRYSLTARQRKLYRQMEEESIAWLRSNPMTAELDITRRIRLREITLAESDIDASGEVFFPDDAHSSLLETVREMLGDLGSEQILMGTHSAKFARWLADRVDSAEAWTGGAKESEREEMKRRFLLGDARSLVATQAGIGEGTDELQHASRVLFDLSRSDWPLMNQQFYGRLNRKGQEGQVLLYRFIAEGTIDDPQAETLLKKELAMRESMGKVVAS